MSDIAENQPQGTAKGIELGRKECGLDHLVFLRGLVTEEDLFDQLPLP